MTRATEMKKHFEMIRDGNLRAAIKPQQISHIARAFDGTAAQLLEKYDERGAANTLVKDLGLENSMHKELSELSGGEMQRLATAAVASRDVDFYFFDEPSSYNDVYQRTGVARVIHALANSGKSVMVVEHDLTLLDYLSDYIEVVYGEPAAYGIVSGVLSTKVGINVFLDGYLPSENVRFRDKAFTFDVSTADNDFVSDVTAIEYPRLVKNYPSFSIEIEAGKVKKGQVLGIVGANALGKTTFMKMISGVLKPDSGEIKKEVKISYKPQYLKSDTDAETISVLERAAGCKMDGSEVEERIIDPLRIKKLYNKSISKLSGGELQKVAVASCLLQKADVYALDEPSAFLDVEDRIAVAKFLQKFVRSYGLSAIVIDHDIQMMDLISDTMVLFEGVSGTKGRASAPLAKTEAMNRFLRSLGISFRRDEKSLRPRVNKKASRLDKDQKSSGNFYYRN